MKTEFLDLRNMDCMDLMATFPDGHFDLAVVDPPYGIGYDGADQSSGRNGGRKGHDWKGWDTSPPSAAYFTELKRVAKNQIIWGANYFTEHLPPSMGWIVWRKNRGKFSSSDAELAYSSFQRALREYTKNPLVLATEGGTIHPTQKPICLYKWILSNYAESGWKILDTHMGSGSIAIAAHYARIHLTACELDKDYYEAACKRIERETRQLDFFSDAIAQDQIL